MDSNWTDGVFFIITFTIGFLVGLLFSTDERRGWCAKECGDGMSYQELGCRETCNELGVNYATTGKGGG